MHVWRRSGNGFVQAHSGTGLEGVIAKKKDSLYFKGKRTKSWLKMKHLIDYDFVVCWYVDKGKLYNQPTTTFTPLETVQTGACTYKIFVYKSADISYNESAML